MSGFVGLYVDIVLDVWLFSDDHTFWQEELTEKSRQGGGETLNNNTTLLACL